VYAVSAGPRDREHYEWPNILRAEACAREHPDEEGVELLHARIAAARRRRTIAAESGEPLGFALVLWRR
jgi:hypothetical protein